MSFSASVPATDPADFPAAVDAAQTSPLLSTEAGKTLFQKGQAAAKDFAASFDGDFPIRASISGHVCEESPGSSPYDSLTVSVAEVAPTTGESPTA